MPKTQKKTPPPGGDGARAILEAAETLFARKGYDAVSSNEIAQAAGVSKANVFHHFGDKKSLYLAVLRAACQDESAALLEELNGQGGPVIERLHRFVTGHLAMLLRNERSAQLIQREVVQSSDDRAKELAEQVFGDNYARLLAIIEAGQRQGELRQDVEPPLIAMLLLAGNVFYFEAHRVFRHLPGAELMAQPERYNSLIMDALLNGIRPR